MVNGQLCYDNIYSELVDISIPRNNDEGYKYCLEHIDDIKEDDDSHLRRLVINDAEFIMYGIEGMLHDLSQILFVKNVRPWDDNKYNKRIKRYLILTLL